MPLELRSTSQFRKDLKRVRQRNADMTLLERAIAILLSGEELPASYRDHVLVGQYAGAHECHIKPDWLLIYEKDTAQLVLIAYRTGSHSDLFR